MKKTFVITSLFVLYVQCLCAQNKVEQRIILIGDAGKINAAQKAILRDAISRSLPGKTIAVFLGDNIYPKGMELSGDKKTTSQDILRSQFDELRKNGVPVYFIPGNHDWDKSGPGGYDKIIAANNFIEAQQDTLLKMIPADGCPGPYELAVSDNLVIVAMDSEWWLYPFDKQTDKSDCACKTKRDVLGSLSDIIDRNKNKVIIFATHHPFNTYGTHGGHYTLKDNIFPLTNLNKNLYLPLPVIGSLYPVLRKSFPTPEDEANVLYRDMKKSVDDILKTHPNVIHVSGHEHTLQLIQGQVLQVVSGAGSKHTPVKKGRGSLYAADSSGYVLADIMNDNSVKLSYFTYDDKTIHPSLVYEKPFTQPAAIVTAIKAPDIGDSIKIKINNQFDKVSGMHRNLFGENYRKIWGLETNLPVLKISKAGLVPQKKGGGMQTHSLRLTDGNGKEWVLRDLNKFTDALLPQELAQTLASDLLQDNFSAIFPYAPLSVPVFANALGVAHTNPSIVYIAPDKQLGIYNRDFSNTVALLEEREPLGKSLSTIKMQEKLKADNDNSVDQLSFLTARVQDIFLGDWDRHGDQWRWLKDDAEKNKTFKPVPRDRDQVFYINQGLFPKIASLPWIAPKLQGFGEKIRNVNTSAFNARYIDGVFTNGLSYDDWMKATNAAVNALTDSVIETALKQMPAEVYQASHTELFYKLQKRRQELLRAAPMYYNFLNKVIDISTSDKNEQVVIHDTLNGKLSINIYRATKDNETGKTLYSRIIDPAVTKAVNIYTNGGEDSISISNQSSPVKIRIIGSDTAKKEYQFTGKAKYLRKVHVYEGEKNASLTGQTNYVHKHFSNEPANTAMVLTNRYNKTTPLLTFGYNVDDGLLAVAGVRWIKQGFRKQPYASIQQFTAGYGSTSGAASFSYSGEWVKLIGKADLLLSANGDAPGGQNFYGLGNQSLFSKTGDYTKYYRSRFSIGNAAAALRWSINKTDSITAGAAFQTYTLDADDNTGRFINNSSQLHSYDSATIFNSKSHAGILLAFTHDSRNDKLIPTFGSRINIKLQGFTGLNTYSKSYMQLSMDMAGYKSIDRKSNLVISDRIGGGTSVGKPAFYQSFFLGSHENLYGYRQYRFGGEHIVYNNFEARLKLTNLASYILPGQLGLVGFYDIGRVWQKNFNGNEWHQGTGGGIYFAPAQLMMFQFVMAGSKEAWYPYLTAGFRF